MVVCPTASYIKFSEEFCGTSTNLRFLSGQAFDKLFACHIQGSYIMPWKRRAQINKNLKAWPNKNLESVRLTQKSSENMIFPYFSALEII